jgi:hypothetical protein
MWEVLRKGTAVQKGKTALRVDVADAMNRSGQEMSLDVFLLGPPALSGLWVAA